MCEASGQTIDQRNHLVSTRNRQRAAGTEVVLDIDDQQRVAVADGETLAHGGALS